MCICVHVSPHVCVHTCGDQRSVFDIFLNLSVYCCLGECFTSNLKNQFINTSWSVSPGTYIRLSYTTGMIGKCWFIQFSNRQNYWWQNSGPYAISVSTILIMPFSHIICDKEIKIYFNSHVKFHVLLIYNMMTCKYKSTFFI